jgi:hypothetical protein
MQQKSWAVALILSIFFGVLGIDRFYLGYTGKGILKLNVSSDLREPEQVTLPADTRSRHTTYELALLSMVL